MTEMRSFASGEHTPSTIAPVTQERLKALLDAENWHWFVDKDGDLGGSWGVGQFYFILGGEHREILQITGTWNRVLPIEVLDCVREFIARWHREKLWPKCYHRIDDNGGIRVTCENIVDWDHGATDRQLGQQIEIAIRSAHDFLAQLEEAIG